ncbi:hypothetical protein ACFFUB_05655 [Algimonas porphyrae]|uniref:DUF362 domain-containing protein n=1 Tax=Algimonas porphyrae TaxID=1128113 RepID=A0ABQ5V481_9PROT|nr:hypothetical protein [Algimonas porphyrae]GLQ21774.1 hypothetical protein GCM10007854_27290 [Algimonas porphyrae]
MGKSKSRKLSFEALHLYPVKGALETDIATYMRTLKRWLPAVKAAYPKHDVVMKVFVDDYTYSDKPLPERDEIEAALLSAFQQHDIPLDYIAYESDCARSCYHLKSLIVEEPNPGAGSFNGEGHVDGDSIQWRYSPQAEFVGMDFDHFSRESRNNVGIGLQLSRNSVGKDVSWSCPAAAAWWQLVRLGGLVDFPEKDEEADQSDESLHGAPAGTWKNPESDKTFVCDQTLSLLPVSYISVEHAVRTILNFIPETGPLLRKKLRKPADQDNLNAIAYIFNG